MKKIILLLLFCLSISHLYAQNDKKNLIGTHIAFGTGEYWWAVYHDGPSHNTNYYYTIGLNYSRQLSKRWTFGSGLEYTYNDMTVTPSLFMGNERPPWSANLTLITVPVQFKYRFGKVFYLNVGPILNILATERGEAFGFGAEGWYPLNKEYKNAVALLFGLGMGIGFEHEFNSGITIFLNPYLRFNGGGKGVSLQKEALERYQYGQCGVSLGVGYRF